MSLQFEQDQIEIEKSIIDNKKRRSLKYYAYSTVSAIFIIVLVQFFFRAISNDDNYKNDEMLESSQKHLPSNDGVQLQIPGGWSDFRPLSSIESQIFDKVEGVEGWYSGKALQVSEQVVNGVNQRFIVKNFDLDTREDHKELCVIVTAQWNMTEVNFLGYIELNKCPV